MPTNITIKTGDVPVVLTFPDRTFDVHANGEAWFQLTEGTVVIAEEHTRVIPERDYSS